MVCSSYASAPKIQSNLCFRLVYALLDHTGTSRCSVDLSFRLSSIVFTGVFVNVSYIGTSTRIDLVQARILHLCLFVELLDPSAKGHLPLESLKLFGA